MTAGEIVLFESSDAEVRLPVSLEDDTVWLSQAQMAELFGRTQPVIARHIGNVFSDGEVERESNMHYLHISSSERPVAFYSLDVIISVGYRVKSQRGVEFRRWATDVLRRYIVRFGGEGSLFGVEKDESFKGAIGNVFQSFDGRDLYSTLEE